VGGDGQPVAVGLAEDVVLRTGVAPHRDRDRKLALALAETMAQGRDAADVSSTPCRRADSAGFARADPPSRQGGFTYVDALSGTAARRVLLERGWSADPDPWVLLYKEFRPKDAALPKGSADTRPIAGPDEVAARVAVQRSAFEPGSTFTAERWQQMSTGPSYNGRFDMVTWTPSGQPAAAATGWFAGPGRCAILEPVGTHQDHRRHGYGRTVNRAVMAALAAAGASGVRVHTPASNTGALATYEACGLRGVEWTTAVMAPR